MRLVQNLRQLRRTEDLADGRHYRLGVDQVVRHGRRHFLVHAHLFLDGAFHADKADAELVLKQFANSAHAAVAEVIDIVDAADVFAQFQEIANGAVKILRVEGAPVEIGSVLVFEKLDIEFETAHARKIILPRIEKHSVEQGSRGVERRGISWPQLAVNLDQRFLRSLNGIAAQSLTEHGSNIIALREEQAEFDDWSLENFRQLVGGQFRVGFEQHLARSGIDNVAGHPGAFQIGDVDFDLINFCFLYFLQNCRIDLAPGVHDLVPGFVLDAVREVHSDQVCRLVAGGVKRPIQPLIANGQTVDVIEGAQNVFPGAKAESAEEDRAQELALAVDTDVEHVLLVVFELYPRSAIRNDLAQEVRAIVGGFEEHAGRAVQLADDHALCTIDDESSVFSHQRNVAEENLLLLDVADGAIAGLGVLLINGQPHSDLQRGGVGHTALFALADVILQLQADRITALVAEVRCVGVVS